jgi:ABC-type sugar transport system substrate-binding protein
VDVVKSTNDPTTAEQRIVAYLTANPGVNAVVTTGASCINAANIAAKELGAQLRRGGSKKGTCRSE